MGVVRGNLVVQVTFCHLICLEIVVYHCVSTKLRRNDLVELAIERHPGRSGSPSSAKDILCVMTLVFIHKLIILF